MITSGRRAKRAAWAKLAAGLAALFAAVALAEAIASRTETIRHFRAAARSRAVDPSALFYTEVSEVGRAEVTIRESLRRERATGAGTATERGVPNNPRASRAFPF